MKKLLRRILHCLLFANCLEDRHQETATCLECQTYESLAGVLAQCTALAELDLSGNYNIGTVGEGRLQASWRGQASGLVF